MVEAERDVAHALGDVGERPRGGAPGAPSAMRSRECAPPSTAVAVPPACSTRTRPRCCGSSAANRR